MKTNILLLCISSGLLVTSACENKKAIKKTKKEAPPVIEVEAIDKIVPVTCNLMQMDFQLGESSRSIAFSYDKGIILEGKMTTPESDSAQILNYTHKDGNLTHFSLNIGAQRMEGSYAYSNNLLTSFTSGSAEVFLTYDSLGQIKQDSSRFKKRVYQYNVEGLPIKANVFNQRGEEIERVEVTYDSQINPFKGKSTFVNMLEVLIGYPMANQTRNITSIRTSYLKKSKYRINGVYKKEGEIAQTTFDYQYNEYGYPVSIGVSSEDEEDTMTLTYNCD